MVTNRDDDYLICKHYRNHINDVSSEYKDFITFTHNENHFFAWINDGKIVMRSEAYPSHDKMERGIKAIIKNRDMQERYSIDSQHGAHFLVLWGGGNHQKHTGNMDKHNEIGRSCPVKDKNDLAALMGFMGKDFVDGVFGTSKGASTGAAIAAATAGAATLAASSGKKAKATGKTAATATGAVAYAASSGGSSGGGSSSDGGSSSGGGFNWKWLLPLLLLIPLFFWWKGCGDKPVKPAKAKTEVSTADKAKADAAKLAATKKAEADAAAKAKADADAAKFAAEKEAAEAKAAKAKAAKARGGSGVSRNAGTGAISYRGNKSDGY